ncbi:Mbeg1-like protein [Psittacicella gerlachiana]|uniref:Fungal lipase-like domain-containing protein n=1 Tax=Psittacicella gerlachiana TaxID=2028574 RepID=A0A3A1YHD2_9GAMM|nr:Mbeg1-like protein [Psittacicella gerlachiana]RIY36470.1 hypothetical protein CKF59_02665 [Psittacicella gerlachiana]
MAKKTDDLESKLLLETVSTLGQDKQPRQTKSTEQTKSTKQTKLNKQEQQSNRKNLAQNSLGEEAKAQITRAEHKSRPQKAKPRFWLKPEEFLVQQQQKLKQSTKDFINQVLLARIEVPQELEQVTALLTQLNASSQPQAQVLAQELEQTWRLTVLCLLTDYTYTPKMTPAGFIDISSSVEELSRLNLSPEDLVLPEANFKVRVFKKDPQIWREEFPRYYICFKGTDFYSWQDWKNNFQQALGVESQYYQQAVKLGKKVKLSPIKEQVYGIGHSLGGGLAAVFACVAQVKTTTFNAAGVHPHTLESDQDQDLIEAIYLPGEWLQELQEFKYAKENIFGTGKDFKWETGLPTPLGEVKAIELEVGVTPLDKHFSFVLNRGFRRKLKACLQECADYLEELNI